MNKFYKKIQYPDGDFYIELSEVKKEFTFRVNSYNALWELNHLVDVLNHNGVVPCITIPNLVSCQADRRFGENQSFGYNLVHKFLGGLNAKFKIFHPHQDMCSLLDNVEIIDNSQFISSVLCRIREEWVLNLQPKDLILMSTDGGSYKWINKLADKIGWEGEVYGASKSRKYEDGKSKLVQHIDKQDFEGKDVIVLDDLSIYGGTFIGLAKMLKERNCGKLYLAVSHLTVAKPNPELFNLFDKVFTTNSKGLDYLVSDSKGEGVKPKNLEIINLF